MSCTDPNGNCKDCCDIVNNATKRRDFGYTNDVENCVCHDICTQDIRFICVESYTDTLNLADLGAKCRGADFDLDRVAGCRIVVNCAEEHLRADCKAVTVTARLTVIFEDANDTAIFGWQPKPINFTCTTFRTFPDNNAISGDALKREIRKIDGSCLVFDLSCSIDRVNLRAIVSGKVIDKLWKDENLLVSALDPYDQAITVNNVFTDFGQAIPPCN